MGQTRTSHRGPTTDEITRKGMNIFFLSCALAVPLTGALYWLESRSKPVPSTVVDSGYSPLDVAKRQEFLDSLFARMRKEMSHVSRPLYDPKMVLQSEYAVELARPFLSPNSEVQINTSRPLNGYALNVPALENVIASGQRYPIFFGDKFFERREYGEQDWRSAFIKGQRRAEIASEGFGDAQYNQWIMLQVNSSQIPRPLLSALAEIDASLHSLQTPGISVPRRFDAQKEIEEAAKQLYNYVPFSPASQKLIEDCLRKYNFDIPAMAIPAKQNRPRFNPKLV